MLPIYLLSNVHRQNLIDFDFPESICTKQIQTAKEVLSSMFLLYARNQTTASTRLSNMHAYIILY